MELLNKLTLKNLKLNKKRTIVTIIGILLSVSLITAVASMFFSARTSLIKFETEQKGNFHYSFFNVPIEEAKAIEQHRKMEKVFFTNPVGYAELSGIQNEYKPYIYVQSYSKEAMENMGIRLTEGRLPEKEGEILISRHLYSNGGVKLNIGDTITLDVGRRVLDGYELNQTNPYTPDTGEQIVDAETKEYVIVGEMERLAIEIEPYSAPGYTFLTCLTEENISEYVDVYVRYNRDGLKEHGKLTAQILGVDEEAFCISIDNNAFHRLDKEGQDEVLQKTENPKYVSSYNEYLVVLETGILGDSALNALAAAAGIVVVIIIITSVFCIRNSFDISITEKIRQYGMLSSIGATKRQIRKNVYYEAFLLGIVGIPLGILAGVFAAVILIQVSNYFLQGNIGVRLVFDLSWLAIGFAVILGAVTIFLSARKSAVKAAKISPIQAIRNSEDIKVEARKIRCPKWVSHIFGVGGEISYKNLKRSKKKYRATIISIIVCVTVFIALYSFIDLAFRVVGNEFENYGYSIAVSYTSDGTDHYTDEVRKIDKIKDVSSMISASVILDEIPYSKEYQNYLNEAFGSEENSEDADIRLRTFIMDDEDFRDYVSDLHLDYDEVKEKGILINQVDLFYYPEGNQEYVELRIDQYDWKAGDIIKGHLNIRGEEKDMEIKRTEDFTVEIAAVSEEAPMGVPIGASEASLIVGEDYGKKLAGATYMRYIHIDSLDAVENEKDVEAIFANHDSHWNVNNVHEEVKMMESVYTLVAIFLYGFIIVIALIGVTNIFNTITTNMNLRRREFAMLKSIGMTDKEFRRMISLESFFYGMRSLLIGVPVGTVLSYVIYRVMMSGSFQTPYELPMGGILISVIAVFLLIWMIMSYSMGRIGQQNIIETIRNENI